jgi:hypothetical protein
MEELQQLREKYINAIIKALVNIHKKTAEHEKILKLARMIVDTKYNIHLVSLMLLLNNLVFLVLA